MINVGERTRVLGTLRHFSGVLGRFLRTGKKLKSFCTWANSAPSFPSSMLLGARGAANQAAREEDSEKL